jgi:hypothetical protein
MGAVRAEIMRVADVEIADAHVAHQISAMTTAITATANSITKSLSKNHQETCHQPRQSSGYSKNNK